MVVSPLLTDSGALPAHLRRRGCNVDDREHGRSREVRGEMVVRQGPSAAACAPGLFGRGRGPRHRGHLLAVAECGDDHSPRVEEREESGVCP